ncbi:MAG: SDR family oxidoreductase [Gomphosphaeria aponina SAG 52.96 = DSM 107014]|uniref:SDR family oxidoreductase n=1 Tax=Gomphosphaeria aponina SAG 52.96 = DSM 107014 TaxID=1521640 RepID=A0A941JST6_9CHRO|nr:SDR family oxidoreductase [Gomphosphaeria aponina SAG 52.96 = DSM 107014]
MSKLILITGVSRGLGREMTEEFIRGGHTVLGCARNEQEIKLLQQEFGRPHDFSKVDVTNEEQVRAWSVRILSNYDSPDLLINNAAVVNHPAPLWEIDSEEFDQVIDVNIKGVANVIRHFVPAMVERDRGVIVNFSSGWGRSTSPNVAPYCTTKWAIEGLTQALAQELPSAMAAVALSPGIINTEMLQIVYGANAADYISPKQWATKAVPFLLKLAQKDNGKALSIPG